MCSLAVMLRDCCVESEQDETLFNPWVLNQRLIDCGAFSSAADLELSDIRKLYPLEYLGEVPYSGTAMDAVKRNGLPCLITMPGNNAARHFTSLLDVMDDDALVFDPCAGERRLSTYDRICEMRLFAITEEACK